MAPEKSFILVVDDNPDGREMLVEYLRYRGFEVVAASGGRAGIDYAIEHRPTLILMDLQMPGLDGWDATRELKANADLRDVIVIAVSAHAMIQDEGTARAAGCDGFVTKPYAIDAFADAIAEVMAHGRRGLAAIAALAPAHRSTRRRSPKRR